MYMKKYATADAVLAKIRDPENMNPEQLRKVIAPLKLKQDKGIRRTQNYLLIRYCWWIHVEKRERIVIDGEEHNLNTGNLTDCADISISDYATDKLIANYINAGDSKDFSDDAAGALVAVINAINSTDFALLLISNDSAGGLIDTAIDAGNSTGCADDAAGGLIDAIHSGNYMGCANITVSDDAVDGLIAITTNAGN